MNLLFLQKEAEHSYIVYLECSGVLYTNEAKLSLLKWPGIAGTAINIAGYLLQDNTIEKITELLEKDLAFLEKELETVILEPIMIINKAACDRFKQIVGTDPKNCDWYKKELTSDVVNNKNLLIAQTNLIFQKLTKFTGEDYPEISYYDHGNN